MSEHTNGKSRPNDPQAQPELRAIGECFAVDYSGLARAIEALSAGELGAEPCAALLRHELARVQQQVSSLLSELRDSTVTLRQLREAAQFGLVQKQDQQKQEQHKQLQDENDRFVANLLQEHESELAAVRRERDAAMDRVRELSRELNRSNGTSSPNLPRVSNLPALRVTTAFSEVDELKSRVEELLRERERSVRLLRQVAEQRDEAERRLRESRPADSRPSASSRSGSGISAGVEGSEPRRTRTATEPYISSPPWQKNAPTIPPVPDLPQPETAVSAAASQSRKTSQDLVSAVLKDAQTDQPPSPPTNRVGTYTMRAEDLAADAVFVLPSGKRRPPNP